MAEQYEKKELRQHIYDTPDTYVGGIDKISEVLPIKDSDKIVFKEIEYIPALDCNKGCLSCFFSYIFSKILWCI